MLEVSTKRDQDLSEYIKLYLEEGRSHNKMQGINGAYFGCTYESLDVVCNIVEIEEIILVTELLNNIIETRLETLS